MEQPTGGTGETVEHRSQEHRVSAQEFIAGGIIHPIAPVSDLLAAVGSVASALSITCTGTGQTTGIHALNHAGSTMMQRTI